MGDVQCRNFRTGPRSERTAEAGVGTYTGFSSSRRLSYRAQNQHEEGEPVTGIFGFNSVQK